MDSAQPLHGVTLKIASNCILARVVEGSPGRVGEPGRSSPALREFWRDVPCIYIQFVQCDILCSTKQGGHLCHFKALSRYSIARCALSQGINPGICSPRRLVHVEKGETTIPPECCLMGVCPCHYQGALKSFLESTILGIGGGGLGEARMPCRLMRAISSSVRTTSRSSGFT